MDNLLQKKKVTVKILRKPEEAVHAHREIELLYVMEGTLCVVVDGHHTEMREHDILIVNSGKQHHMVSSGKQHPVTGLEDLLYLQLMIRYEAVSDVTDIRERIFWCDSTRNRDDAYPRLEALLKQLMRRYLTIRGEGADFLYISLCYQVLDELCARFLTGHAIRPAGTKAVKDSARTAMIETFLHTHYAQSISLKELSEQLYLSPGYLSRFFHKQFGMPFGAYLTKVRLGHALEDILYSDEPITRIIYDNGFSNVSAFNKAFRDTYHETPLAMRRRQAAQHPEPEAAVLEEDVRQQLKDYLWQSEDENEDQPGSRLEEAVVDGTQKRPFDTIGNRILNAGSADDLYRSGSYAHMQEISNAAGIRYIRFWHPFSEAMLIDPEHPDNLNFSRLDTILDALCEDGLHPWIELGAKPRRVTKRVDAALVFEAAQKSADETMAEQVLGPFLEHVIGRYGYREVMQWRFELWMDFDAAVADADEVATYVNRFIRMKQILGSYAEQAKLGGAGLHGYGRSLDPQASITPLLREAFAAKECMPDFITMYSYAYDFEMHEQTLVSTRSSDRDLLRHGIEMLYRDWPEIRQLDVPVYVTEWNLTVSHRNLLNDACFMGAYIMRNLIDLAGGGDPEDPADRMVDGVAWFMGSDRVSEYYDTGSCLFGGPGLVTRDGIMKPSGFALAFYNRTYPYLVQKGEHYLVTTDGRGRYCILCHNMKALGYNYFLEPEDALEAAHMNRYFEELDALELKLTLTGLADGPWRLRIRRVNARGGSVFDYWQALGFEKNLEREDIRYLQKVCEPQLEIRELEAADGCLRITHTLLANEIACLQVEPRMASTARPVRP